MASEEAAALPTSKAAGVDLQPVDALRRFLQAACAPLFFESAALKAEVIQRDLATGAAGSVLEQFIGETATRVLQVHCLPSQDDGDEAMDESASDRAWQIRVNVGIEYASDGKKSSHNTVCFIKRFSAPLVRDQTLNDQLQVMTLGLGTRPRGDKRAAAASSSGENTEDEDEDRGNLLSVVYNYVHQSFGPLVNEYSKVHQSQNESTAIGESSRGGSHS